MRIEPFSDFSKTNYTYSILFSVFDTKSYKLYAFNRVEIDLDEKHSISNIQFSDRKSEKEVYSYE